MMISLASLPKLVLTVVVSCLPLSSAWSQDLINPSDSQPREQPLISPETGVNYTSLQNRLKAQQWQEANEITANLMLEAINRDEQGWMSREDLAQLACWDLKTIDNLWKEYSQGKFGFTVQFPIFIETGNRPGRLLASDTYDEFGNRVGWRKDNQWINFKHNLTFNLNAPVGHLPNPRSEYQITGGRLNYTALTQRMVECGIVSYTLPNRPNYGANGSPNSRSTTP